MAQGATALGAKDIKDIKGIKGTHKPKGTHVAGAIHLVELPSETWVRCTSSALDLAALTGHS